MKLTWGLFLLFLAMLFLLPVYLWFSDEKIELQVAIIDKTVPSESYREHLGITWVLNHFGYVKQDETSYDKSSDYFGFVPDEANQTYRIQPLPTSYEDIDLIYLADTYGVYEDDLPWIDLDREGTRSSLIYGGLEMEEWQTIIERLQKDKQSTLIVEFNSFASPTDEVVRESVSDYLQLEWSGWSGRYFEELDPELNSEIPEWMLLHYEEVLASKWEYKGAGFVLVNEQKEELVVLLAEEHFGYKGIRLNFTERGTEKFGLEESPNYMYWFDIVTAKSEQDVLAYYDWDLTESGTEELLENNIPLQFAGIIEHERPYSRSYYFAGDFTDIANVPAFYKYKGLNKIMELLSLNKFSEKSFYWKTYVPIMKTLLSEVKDEISDEEKHLDVAKEGVLAYTSRINEDSFEIYVNDEWDSITIKGVNIGKAKPGVFPGEAAITEEEYFRWLQYIGEMGANTIRIYTLHPPGFYHALKSYNEQSAEPIYLLQGVWVDEEPLEETLDAFDLEITDKFQEEMKRIVDVIHGNAFVEHRPGHAHGVYHADISQYVIGWIIGIEWYPQMVEGTNEKHATIGDYDGNFVETTNAQGFEHWLAYQLDESISYEADRYQWIRPVSFTNWVTTDLLTHPAEPNVEEDMVGVDPNVINIKGAATATNQFASYHVYPYYPDFLNYESRYLEFVDHRGEFNNYAAYLKDLHEAHEMPILIAEFGVPGSRGMTHENPFGKNQGFLSEEEQGEITVQLYEDIVHEGLLGGLIFTWQDEWFKRTWNTMDYDSPERRPYWSNAQTNEQQFGLLSFDRHKIKVDGDLSDWQDVSPLYTSEQPILEKLFIDHDERYLYLRLDLTVDSEQDPTVNGFPILLLDTIPNQGNQTIETIDGVTIDQGIDFVIEINGNEQSRVLVDRYYDLFKLQYDYEFLEPEVPLPVNNSGSFQPIHFALNQEIRIPSQNKVIPFSYYETGQLHHGNGNPEAADYDSLADFYSNPDDGIIEIRIPWLLLSFKDPSQREVISNIYEEDEGGIGELIDGIHVGVLFVQPTNNEDFQYEVIDSLPELQNGKMVKDSIEMYSWEPWDLPLYEERLKKSYYIVKKAFTSSR